MGTESDISTVKGRAVPEEQAHPDIDPSGLDPLEAPIEQEIITIQTEEVSGICPVEYREGRDVRDYYRLTIAFTPNPDEPVSVELKSLKLYLEQYQNVPISHEQVASTAYTHLKELLNPESLYVRCEPNIRGGLTTMIELGSLPEGKDEVISHKDA